MQAYCLFKSDTYYLCQNQELTLNIASLARQCCLPSWGPRRTPWFFCNFSNVCCSRLLKLCFLGLWNNNSMIQALLASNILCLFISTEVTGVRELLHTHSSLIQHLNSVIFWALSAGHFSNLQRSEPKNNKNNNIPHLLRSIPSGVPVGPQGCFDFLFFFKEHLISLIT